MKKKCVEYAIKRSFDVVVFPEYTYDTAEYDYMIGASERISILAGTYQDDKNYNQSIVFIEGQAYQEAKRHLSPYEKIIPSNYSIHPSEEVLSYITINGSNSYLLTCFDYYEFSVEQYRKSLSNGEMVELLFSQCCNNNPVKFLKEAESIHNHIDNITSVICNVSKLKTDLNEYTEYGKSAIFGLYDKNSIENIRSNGWCDPFYDNMITIFPDGDIVCEI